MKLNFLIFFLQGLISNEILGYFLVKIQHFLHRIGISQDRLRFRQHLNNEIAHYATDCWDAECLTSFGWIECVGCADRSAYDLIQHGKASGVSLVAEKKLSTPKEIDATEIQITNAFSKKLSSKKSKQLRKLLESLSTSQRNYILGAIENDG